MPNGNPGNGLIWGSGLSQGANNFLQAYMAVKQQDHAEKMTQNAELVKILMGQLNDENLTLRRRAQILDMIPNLIGIKKMPRRLSYELGLTPEFLNSQEVITPGTPGTEGTSDQGLAGNATPVVNTIEPNNPPNVIPPVSPVAVQSPIPQADDSDVIKMDANQAKNVPITNNNDIVTPAPPVPALVKLSAQQMVENLRNKMSGITSEGTPATSATIRGMQATSDIPAVTMARGDLTPYLIKRGQTQQEAEEEWKMKQRQLIFATNLAKENAKAEGFTIHLGNTVDPKTGGLVVNMANAQGETKKYPLEGESETMARARIMGGKLNKTVAERKAYWQTQINPQTGEFFTDDEADVLALNDANTVWKAKLSGTQANTARNVAAAGGLTPIQPAQAAAQQLQIATTRGTIKGALRTATQLMTQSLSKAEQAEANTKNYYEKTIQKQKDAMRNYLIGIKQNPDAPDQSVIGVDKDYQKMNKAHDEMIIEYNRLKQISDTARATYEGHATAKQAAQDQLDSFEEEIKNLGVTGVPQGVQNTPVGGLQVISQRPDVKAKLKQYRDLHPEDKRNDFTVIQGMIAHKIITP